MISIFRTCLLLAISVLGIVAAPARGMTEQERAKIVELTDAMRAAGQAYSDGKFADSAAKIAEIQSGLVELLKSRDPALQRLAKPLYSRLGRAHGLLELKGAELEALPSWQELTTAPPMEEPPATPTISFTKEIAPWFVSTCGNCHINNQRGQFSMANFNDLMRGAGGAVVLFAGSARGSRLVEVIESGDMPRGGGKVSSEQLTALKTWIDEGAKFDGPDPAASLTSLVPGGAASTPSRMQVKAPTGSETVSFSKDIAPILMENCNGCHIAGRRASGNLRMDTFAQLLRGGDSGAVIAPQAADSLLIQKLKGESGQRMPAGGRPPLSEDKIELISTWIGEGAAYDGPSPDTNLETVVNQAWASAATHEELFQRRQQRSLARWTRVLPNDEPASAKTDELFVLGNVPPARIETMLDALSSAIEETKRLLRADAKQPLVKGGLTVFVLKSRYDYSEFGRMTENRELPKDWLGHWHADPLDAYGVLAADTDVEDKQAAAVALQVVSGAYLGSFSGVPTWFGEGVARNLVRNEFRRGDDRVLAWQRSLPAAMLKVENAKSLLEGRLDEEAAGLVGMSLTNFMMERTNRRRFDKLLELLRAGQPFDTACTATFAPPEALVKTWLGK
jgi:mono/diheme cytochrome c family protein